MFYDTRREISSYKNYMKPICNAIIEPVFIREVERDVEDDRENEIENLFTEFLTDVDNCGTPMQDFSQLVISTAVRAGVSFVVMDNFSQGDQPQTYKEALEKRAYPYVFQRKAQCVEKFRLSKFGKLDMIMFRERRLYEIKNGVEYYKEYAVEYDNENITVYLIDNGVYTVVDMMSHGLDVIPVIPVYTVPRREPNQLLVDPPMYDLAKMCWSIYNKDSEIRDLERANGFSVLCIQSAKAGNFSVGPNNVLIISPDVTNMPQYISPNPSVLSTLLENNKDLREELYRVAEQTGVIGVQSAKSGIAKEWDFRAQESLLKIVSKAATTLEYAISDMFKLYTKESYNYTVHYPYEFAPDADYNKLDMYRTAIKELSPPDEMKKLLLDKSAHILFSDESEETMQKVLDDIYKEPEPEPEAPATMTEAITDIELPPEDLEVKEDIV
jgi:hypothetical protein